MRTLKIPNLKIFREEFIQPLVLFTDSARIKISGNMMSYFVHDKESNIYICAEYDITEANNLFVEDFFIDMKNLKKFLLFLNSLNEENLVLSIHSNYIMYNSGDIKLKIHMMDSSALSIPKISQSFLKSLTYDIEFEMSPAISSNIERMSKYVDAADKIYFSYQEGVIFATFTDETMDNTDSISFKVCDYSQDNFEPFILLYKSLRGKISFVNQCISFSYKPSKNLLKIDVKKYNSTISYLTSVAVK